MFDIQLYDSGIKLVIAGVCSVVVATIFWGMSYSYTRKRANKKYSYGRKKAPSISSFSHLSKALFITSMFVTLAGYWVSSPLFFQVNTHYLSQLLGVGIALYGYIHLQRAFSNLDNNYSPLFEAYMPFKLITNGAYHRIRHPIYLYNLFVSFGLAISSGSGLVLMNAMIGLVFVLKAVNIEEVYLAKEFPEYQKYQKRSWRLIPYLY